MAETLQQTQTLSRDFSHDSGQSLIYLINQNNAEVENH
jgi:hypothetical protein